MPICFPLRVNYFSANNNSVLCFTVLGISWHEIEVRSRNKMLTNEMGAEVATYACKLHNIQCNYFG